MEYFSPVKQNHPVTPSNALASAGWVENLPECLWFDISTLLFTSSSLPHHHHLIASLSFISIPKSVVSSSYSSSTNSKAPIKQSTIPITIITTINTTAQQTVPNKQTNNKRSPSRTAIWEIDKRFRLGNALWTNRIEVGLHRILRPLSRYTQGVIGDSIAVPGLTHVLRVHMFLRSKRNAGLRKCTNTHLFDTG